MCSGRKELPGADRGHKSSRMTGGRDGGDPSGGSRKQRGSARDENRHRRDEDGLGVAVAGRDPERDWNRNKETGAGRRK